MAEIVPVVSEALEAQIRDLLPSQRGFGEDLQASNVITPIIDLTAAAQGTNVPEYQAQAWDFSTSHSTVTNATTNLANTPGFWKVDLNATLKASGTSHSASMVINSGITTKVIWEVNTQTSGGVVEYFGTVPEASFIVFLRAGDTLQAISSSVNSTVDVWYRQVASVNGVATNPLGFTPQ